MALTVDRENPVPLYYQVKQILLQKILHGDILPNQSLPSEKELQEAFEVSRITVRRAMSDLVAEGYIKRQSGKGTFVLPTKVEQRSGKPSGIREDLISQGYQISSVVLEYESIAAPKGVAQRLEIDEGQTVILLKKLLMADGEPLAIATAYHNLDPTYTFTRQELEDDSIFVVLERKYGLLLPHAERTIEATITLPEEAELLQVEPGLPMLLVELIVCDPLERPVSFGKIVYRGDRYKYRHSVNL